MNHVGGGTSYWDEMVHCGVCVQASNTEECILTHTHTQTDMHTQTDTQGNISLPTVSPNKSQHFLINESVSGGKCKCPRKCNYGRSGCESIQSVMESLKAFNYTSFMTLFVMPNLALFVPIQNTRRLASFKRLPLAKDWP